MVENNLIREKIVNYLTNFLGNQLDLSPDKIDTSLGFFDIGLTSIGLAKLAESIQSKVNTRLKISDLFEYDSVDKLTLYLLDNYRESFSTI